ncbi:MAG: HutD family protein [Betaproteobacteria bacterium]|nr:HutD family protein [Betaproteobacteria bacterium]
MAIHRVLTPADYRRTPWKNGGGRTTEIAVGPPDAGLADFAWRVSVADVEQDGAFSVFPGVARTLVLLAGDGMRLTGVGEPLEVHAPFEPVTFAGDAPVTCALTNGPVRDFNLMVRRDVHRGDVIIVRERAEALGFAGVYVCYAARGTCECLIANHPPIALAEEHSLLVECDQARAHAGMQVSPVSANAIAVVAVIGLA